MSAAQPRHSLAIWLLLIIGSIVAIVIAMMAVNAVRFDDSARVASKSSTTATPGRTAASLGTSIIIRAGGVEVHRALPMAAFAIQADQSLDPRIPAGPFECEMTVSFLSGAVRDAHLGAEIQNGSVIIHPAGRAFTAEDAAGNQPKTVIGRDLLSFTRAPQQVTYLFKSTGEGPARLRALWQPLDLGIPLPLPSAGAPLLLNDDALAGMALVQQFNCAACHQSADPQLQAQLHVAPGPVLGNIGQRVRPRWLHQWLENPAHEKPGTTMPRIPRASVREIDDLAHFLVSMGGPIDEADHSIETDLIPTGMIAYHTVGCFACHGPLEPIENLPGDRRAVAVPIKRYEPLGDLSAKTTAEHLAAFLLDPLQSRPAARMPAQQLAPLEARAIAAYLLSRAPERHEPQAAQPPAFALDPAKVDRGRAHFASLGCVNCHALGPDRPPIAPALAAPALESLPANDPRACIAPQLSDAHPNAPHFSLSERDRRNVLAFLQSLPHRRCNNVPIDRLAAGMSRLDCTACHRYHGERGPERAIAQYFTTVAEADLGDEGRLPPNLTDVGGKLNPLWMHQVIASGEPARPYMGARMPAFGEQIARELSHAFSAASGVAAQPDDGPTLPPEYASIGRDLVGSKGLACIQCHTIAGHDATGTPGPDLVQAPQRLRYDNFVRWVQAPAHIRPGTRMPSFYSNGVGGLSQLGGEASKQIAAMWAYLSQGEFLPLPDGLVDAGGLELVVNDEPLVFRTFLQPAGFRAIAVGFPEQIHCAFDAEQCRLAAVWTGAFLNAKGAWANRGGSETNPSRLDWTVHDEAPLIQFPESGSSSGLPARLRFRGYRFDEQRRPIFMYDAASPATDVVVRVQEQPIPARTATGGPSLLRRFSLQGPPGTTISILGSMIQLDGNGRAEHDIEINW